MLPADKLSDAVFAVNEWNDSRIWPKAYVHTTDNGEIELAAQHSVDYEAGLSDRQLMLHIECMMGTTHELWEWLAQKFPEHAPETSE